MILQIGEYIGEHNICKSQLKIYIFGGTSNWDFMFSDTTAEQFVSMTASGMQSKESLVNQYMIRFYDFYDLPYIPPPAQHSPSFLSYHKDPPPLLTLAGLLRYLYLGILIEPQINCTNINNFLSKVRSLRDPLTGRPLPRQIPRNVFPQVPDPATMQYVHFMRQRMAQVSGVGWRVATPYSPMVSNSIEQQARENLNIAHSYHNGQAYEEFIGSSRQTREYGGSNGITGGV